MKQKILIGSVLLLVIIMAVVGVLLINAKNDLSTATNTIADNKVEISTLQNQLSEAKDSLVLTSDNLSKTAGNLIEVQTSLNTTLEQLTAKTGELADVTSERLTLKVKVNNLTTDLDKANLEIETLNKSIDLYKETFGQVYQNTAPFSRVYDTDPPSWTFQLTDTTTPTRLVKLVENPDAVNPTFENLITFLRNDKTDMNRYLLDYYVCGNYAETVHNNAEAAGIRTALVLIDFEEGPGHAINAFLTTDKGLVYIDCTGSSTQGPASMDGLVSGLKINATYHESFLFPSYYVFMPNNTKITSIEIYW